MRFSKTNDEGVGLLGIYAVAWLRKRVGMDRRDDVAVGKVNHVSLSWGSVVIDGRNLSNKNFG